MTIWNMGNIVDHRDTVEHRFIENAESHLDQLEDMRKCAVLLQEEKLPLWQCQEYLDILLTTTLNPRNRSRANRDCAPKHILVNNGLSTNSYFETGVAKIQQGLGREDLMNPLESQACEALLKSKNDTEETTNDNDSNEEFDFSKAVKANKKRREREQYGNSQYINCDFIMGSTACVERL